jgi:hypothetical protein
MEQSIVGGRNGPTQVCLRWDTVIQRRKRSSLSKKVFRKRHKLLRRYKVEVRKPRFVQITYAVTCDLRQIRQILYPLFVGFERFID